MGAVLRPHPGASQATTQRAQILVQGATGYGPKPFTREKNSLLIQIRFGHLFRSGKSPVLKDPRNFEMFTSTTTPGPAGGTPAPLPELGDQTPPPLSGTVP